MKHTPNSLHKNINNRFFHNGGIMCDCSFILCFYFLIIQNGLVLLLLLIFETALQENVLSLASYKVFNKNYTQKKMNKSTEKCLFLLFGTVQKMINNVGIPNNFFPHFQLSIRSSYSLPLSINFIAMGVNDKEALHFF